jgi:hypothetical protein
VIGPFKLHERLPRSAFGEQRELPGAESAINDMPLERERFLIDWPLRDEPGRLGLDVLGL